jgi:hypothetical protein
MPCARGLAFALWGLFVVAGCGSEEPAAGVDLTAQYALDTKVKTLAFVEKWRKNPTAAQGQLDSLMEQLNAYESLPVGEHEETYRQLRDATQKVHGAYAEATAEQIEAMKVVAEKLPGDPSTFAYDPN